jgi:hypothetical protein
MIRVLLMSALAIFLFADAAEAQVVRRPQYLHRHRDPQPGGPQNVMPPAPPPEPAAFTVSLSTNSLRVSPGQQITATVTVTPVGGFTGLVTLGVYDAPEGVGGTFDANPLTLSSTQAQSTTLHVIAPSSATTGIYSLAVQGRADSQPNASASATLTIAPSMSQFISQAGVGTYFGEQPTAMVSAQIYDLFFGARRLGALHFRSTLPATTPDEAASLDSPSNLLKQQLLDIFGGNFNVYGGIEWNNEHVFVDATGAFRLIDVPKSETGSPPQPQIPPAAAGTGSALSAFWTTGATIRYVLQGVDASGNPGAVTIVGSAFLNGAFQSDLSARFAAPLQRTSFIMNASVNVETGRGYVMLQGRWSNDDALGRQVALSFNPMR